MLVFQSYNLFSKFGIGPGFWILVFFFYVLFACLNE